MQFTVSALTLIAAAATVQASCVPIITCGMKRDVYHPHAAVLTSRATGDDFSNAFAACLHKDNAEITPAGATSFHIKAKAGGAFHDCDHIVDLYQKSGMKDGKLEKAGAGFTFTPTPADLPGWKAAVPAKKGATTGATTGTKSGKATTHGKTAKPAAGAAAVPAAA